MIKNKDYYLLENHQCLANGPLGKHDYTKTVERVGLDGRITYLIKCTCGSTARALQYANAVRKPRSR